MDIMKTLVENGGWNSCSGISVVHMMSVTLHLKPSLFSHWFSDSWKVSLVDAGCANHLLTVGDLELQQKATDIIMLLLAEG